MEDQKPPEKKSAPAKRKNVLKKLDQVPICHDNFSDRQCQKDVKLWGGKRIRFHDLRHTATTLMIASGVDIKTVKEICGHADITTTMNYVHLLSGSIANVAKVFSLKPVVSGKEVAAEKILKLV